MTTALRKSFADVMSRFLLRLLSAHHHKEDLWLLLKNKKEILSLWRSQNDRFEQSELMFHIMKMELAIVLISHDKNNADVLDYFGLKVVNDYFDYKAKQLSI